MRDVGGGGCLEEGAAGGGFHGSKINIHSSPAMKKAALMAALANDPGLPLRLPLVWCDGGIGAGLARRLGREDQIPSELVGIGYKLFL